VKLSCEYEFAPKTPTCHTAYVQTVFGIGFEVGRNVIARDVEIDYDPGKIVLFLGPSGSGKSSLLRAAAAQRPEAVTLNGRPSGKRTLIDSLGSDVRQAAHLLSLCGLAEAFLMLRTPAELSDGQRYRFAIARCLARRARTVVADEWCAKLDRVTAKVISRNVRRIADQRGVGFLLATTHEDIVADLQPDVIARCGGCGTVEVETRRPFAGRSVFTAGSKSPKAPRRTGRTSLGGITAGTGSGRSGGSTCSGTAASRSGSACSASGRCAARRGTAGSA